MTILSHYEIDGRAFTVSLMPEDAEDPTIRQRALQSHLEGCNLDFATPLEEHPHWSDLLLKAKHLKDEEHPDFDDFLDKYGPLIPNHLAADPEERPAAGAMFETFGAELEFVINADKRHPGSVWTMVDGESGNWWLIPGCHYVNSVGYFVALRRYSEANLQETYLFS